MELHIEYSHRYGGRPYDEFKEFLIEMDLEGDVMGNDEIGYKLISPNPTPPLPFNGDEMNIFIPERITYSMEELYPRFSTIEIFQLLERVVEGMNDCDGNDIDDNNRGTFYAEFYLRNEYNVKYPEKSLNEVIFTTILHYLVVEQVLEQNEDGFYRKVNTNQ